jgi:hypothetical protein
MIRKWYRGYDSKQKPTDNFGIIWLADEYELPPIYGSDSGKVKTMVPAAISRGLPLPVVEDTGDGMPMLAATAYPEDVYAVASLPRAINGTVRTPAAKATFELPSAPKKLSVTGKFSSLRFKWQAEGTETFTIRSLEDPDRPAENISAVNGFLVIDDGKTDILLENTAL